LFIVSSDTNRGKVRADNQDCVVSEKVPLACGEAGLCVVADGMGGHLAGDVASRMAVQELIRYVRSHAGHLHPALLLEQAFAEANAAIYHASEQRPEYTGMGTTLTVALLLSERAYICHVGDSRAYKFADGMLLRLTHDHSVVEELLRHGGISSRDAKAHPQRHVLTRALGATRQIVTDCQEAMLQVGDSLLLCTDGLTQLLSDKEMESVFRASDHGPTVVKLLMDEALLRGAPDNVTILLARREAGV